MGPSKGKHQGKDPSQRQGPPPPTQPHHTPTTARVVPDKTPGEQHARQRSQQKEGGEHATGRQGKAPPPPDPSQEWRGTTAKPLSQDRGGTTSHNPHTHTKPPTQAQRGEGRHPNAPLTRHTRTRAHATHTTTAATNTSATNTHNTHRREHRPYQKRTQHRKPQRSQQTSARRGEEPTANPNNEDHKGTTGTSAPGTPPGEVKGRQKHH